MLAGESLNFILFKNATNFWNKNSKGYMIHLFYLKVNDVSFKENVAAFSSTKGVKEKVFFANCFSYF